MTASRVAAAAVTLVALAGCGGDDGRLARLNGEQESRPTLSIAEARARAPGKPILVRGYLIDPADDRMRLCAGLDEGACTEPSLLVVGLDLERVEGLEHGCCAIGYWSPHELAVPGTVAHDVLYVPAPAR